MDADLCVVECRVYGHGDGELKLGGEKRTLGAERTAHRWGVHAHHRASPIEEAPAHIEIPRRVTRRVREVRANRIRAHW